MIDKDSDEFKYDRELIDIIIIKRHLRYYFYYLKNFLILILFSIGLLLLYFNNKKIISKYNYWKKYIKEYVEKRNIVDAYFFSLKKKNLNLVVVGNKIISKKFLLKYINLNFQDLITSLDINLLKDELLQTGLVDDVFFIKMKIKNTLFIKINESTPVAIVNNDSFDGIEKDRSFIILKNKKKIDVMKNIGFNFNEKDLVKIKTIYDLDLLLNVIDLLKEENLYHLVSNIIQHPSKRTDLIMKNGIKIKCSFINLSENIKKINKIFSKNKDFFNPEYTEYIDLRILNSIYIGTKKN